VEAEDLGLAPVTPRHLRPVGTVEELLADDVDWLDQTIEGVRATEVKALASARAEVASIVATLTKGDPPTWQNDRPFTPT
jgi:hypothetical protein